MVAILDIPDEKFWQNFDKKFPTIFENTKLTGNNKKFTISTPYYRGHLWVEPLRDTEMTWIQW